MKTTKIKPVSQDARGCIADILFDTPVEHVTVIRSLKGAVRGNHYHKETIQWVYLHSGSLESLTRKEGEDVVSLVLEPGDLIMTEVMECHALRSLEDSVFFVFTRGPRGGDRYEDDTFRLPEPLKKD